jgi:coproporphyrinogen III oxidase
MTQTTKTLNWRCIPTLMAACVMTVAVMVLMPAQAGVNDGVDGLNEAQQASAARTLAFIDDMDAKYFARAAEIDLDLVLESKDFNYDYARYETHVGRGTVVEKIGRMIGIIFEPTGEVQEPTVFGRYFGIDVHAKNPNVGFLHAAFLVEIYPDGKSAVGGILNVLPGASHDEDLAMMKAALDEVFEKHGVDSTRFRKDECEGTEIAVDHRFRRRPACVGASFFEFPMMSVTDENFRLVTEAYDRFLGSFMTIVEKRRNEPYTDADIALQDAMRLNWFEDQMFADPYAASGITPYEVWALAFLPPVVKF